MRKGEAEASPPYMPVKRVGGPMDLTCLSQTAALTGSSVFATLTRPSRLNFER